MWFAQTDLNFITFDTNVIDIGAERWIVSPSTIANVEPPRVPGTSHRAFLIQATRAERGSHVGAKVVDGEILPFMEKHRDHLLAYEERLPLAFDNRTDFGDRYKIKHRETLVEMEKNEFAEGCAALEAYHHPRANASD